MLCLLLARGFWEQPAVLFHVVAGPWVLLVVGTALTPGIRWALAAGSGGTAAAPGFLVGPSVWCCCGSRRLGGR